MLGIDLSILERERMHTWVGEGQRVREKRTPHRAGGLMWVSISGPQDHDLRSWRQTLNQQSHPSTPISNNSIFSSSGCSHLLESNSSHGVLFPCFAVLGCEPVFSWALFVGTPSSLEPGSRDFSSNEVFYLFLLRAPGHYQHGTT